MVYKQLKVGLCKATPNWYLGLRILFLKIRSERASEFFIFCTKIVSTNLWRVRMFFFFCCFYCKLRVWRCERYFFFTHKIFIDWQIDKCYRCYANCFIHFSLVSNFLELYDNVFVLSFWHFSVWTSCYSDKMEHWIYKKKISCLLSADGAGALFYFLFLASFVNGPSAYTFYFYFDFLSVTQWTL